MHIETVLSRLLLLLSRWNNYNWTILYTYSKRLCCFVFELGKHLVVVVFKTDGWHTCMRYLKLGMDIKRRTYILMVNKCSSEWNTHGIHFTAEIILERRPVRQNAMSIDHTSVWRSRSLVPILPNETPPGRITVIKY